MAEASSVWHTLLLLFYFAASLDCIVGCNVTKSRWAFWNPYLLAAQIGGLFNALSNDCFVQQYIDQGLDVMLVPSLMPNPRSLKPVAFRDRTLKGVVSAGTHAEIGGYRMR